MTSSQTPAPSDQDPAVVVDTALQKLRNLATLPEIALEIMRLAEDAHSVAEDFLPLINKDPSLCAQILRVVNSPFYSLSQKVDSIQQAIVLLGINAIKNISIAGSCCKLFQRGLKVDGFDPADLWRHSITVANLSAAIAKRTRGASPDEAYLAGMIHDIGLIAEMQLLGAGFAQMVARISREPEQSLCSVELETLGANHEDFGAGICRKWLFPESFQQVVGSHHHPLGCEEPYRLLCAIVHVADIAAVRVGRGFTMTVDPGEINPEVLALLHLNEADLELIAETAAEMVLL